MNEKNIDWIHLDHDRYKLRVLAKKAMKRWIQYGHQWRVFAKKAIKRRVPQNTREII